MPCAHTSALWQAGARQIAGTCRAKLLPCLSALKRTISGGQRLLCPAGTRGPCETPRHLGTGGSCWQHPPCRDQAVEQGTWAGDVGSHGAQPSARPQHTWQRWHPVLITPPPARSRSSLRAMLFVCFVNRHQEAPSGLALLSAALQSPAPSLTASNSKRIFQCGFCGLEMYFRILFWRPRSSPHGPPCSPPLLPLPCS